MIKSTDRSLRSSAPASIRYRVSFFGQDLWLTQNQIVGTGMIAAVLLYLSIRRPSETAIAMSAAVTIVAGFLMPLILAKLPQRKRLSLAYVTAGFLAVAVLMQSQPASAQFFNALEEATLEVVAGSEAGIDEGVVTIIFILFRVLITLAFVAGAVGMLVQMFRGGDWQPIASMIGIGLAFVIGVEVITRLMVGAGGGGGGGAASAGRTAAAAIQVIAAHHGLFIG